jgi:hypothetical protein
MTSVTLTLSALPLDLEVSARAASLVGVCSKNYDGAELFPTSSLHGLPTRMAT